MSYFLFQTFGCWTLLNDQFLKFHKVHQSGCIQFLCTVNLLSEACIQCLNDVSNCDNFEMLSGRHKGE